jgi:acyl carrier protein
MDVSQQVVTIIFEAIDEANEVRPKHEWIKKDPGAQLVGPQSGLDSLGLLNLVLSVEGRVNTKFDSAIDLSGILAIEPSASPLRSVSTLAEYVGSRLQAA